MSLICLCVTDNIEEKETMFYKESLTKLVNCYECGVVFSINWTEPIVEYLKDVGFVFGLVDYWGSNNCEMLLLPDGWYHNGYTNDVVFKERIQLLADVANMLLERGHRVEFYIGCSGMEPEDFFDSEIKCSYFIEFLEKTIGTEGAEIGLHITVN